MDEAIKNERMAYMYYQKKQTFADNPSIKELFKNHKLRQGWGYVFDGMDLDLDQP